MLSLFFVYRNSAALGCNTTIGVFEGLLDYVVDVVDEMEINPYDVSDAGDTE